ncbi:MAG: glycosyltransferase family 2 protein [Niabella sp.]
MKFSIITPIYNRADIIKETLPHILNQDFDEYEVIVVDDGSTDNTWDVLQSISHDKLRIFRKENGERGAARNYGAKQASGEYLNFFDCDDIMYPNHLKTAWELITSHPDEKLFHVCYDFRDASEQLLSHVQIPKEGTAKHLPYNNFLACNTVFVQRDAFLSNPFSENRVLSTAEDWELWLRLVSRYNIIGTDERTFAIIEHAGRSLNTIAPEKVEQRNLLLNQLLKNDAPFNKYYRQESSFFYAHNLAYIALIFAENDSLKNRARQYLKAAIKEYKLIVFNKRFLAALKNSIL